MKYPFRTLSILILLVLTAAACGPAAPAPTPIVIFVPVTVTPETVNQPLPSATSEVLPSPAPLPTATAVPATATSDVHHFYVSGYVWSDTCKPYDAVPNPVPAGCIFEQGVGLYADGIFQTGEPGIGGVTVQLMIDCNYGAFTTTTDPGGFYKMSFTVPAAAGVGSQKVCLSIDATSAQNAPILLPGGWTVPKTNSATALIQVTIDVETQNTVSFGWDYQFK
jgi:hypothetical protein